MMLFKDDLVKIKFKLDNKELEEVYAVMGDLSLPITAFNRLSKKYFYNDDGLRVSRNKSGCIFFSTYSSACQYFKSALQKKEEVITERYKNELKQLEISYSILHQIGLEHPEYII